MKNLNDLVIGYAYKFKVNINIAVRPSDERFIFNGIGEGIPVYPFWNPFLSFAHPTETNKREVQFVRDVNAGIKPEQYIVVEDTAGKKYSLFSNSINCIEELYSSYYLNRDIQHKISADQILSNIKRLVCDFGKNAITVEDYIKFEQYAKIDTSRFEYQIGKIYRTQENREIKIVGRTYLENYECVLGSDGVYRYDRSKDKKDTGRVCGTNMEYFDPKNILREDYGNRYEVIKDFAMNHFGCLSDRAMEIINTIGSTYPRKIIDLAYKQHLESIDLPTIGNI